MENISKNGNSRVLIVNSDTDFAERAKNYLEASFEVLQTDNEKEGIEKAIKQTPAAIILGYLDSPGASFRLYKRLRQGWITRHIPLLVVDSDSKKWPRDEVLQMDAEDYISITKKENIAISQLVEATILKEKRNIFKKTILDTNTFCITWEQIAGRGALEIQQEEIFENAVKVVGGRKIHAISVTDNPGGNPAISSEMFCAQMKKLDIEPLVHLTCKDKNRNEIESLLYGLAAEGVKNILVLTGDYPSNGGFNGRSKPVFDLDAIGALRLIENMNNGLEYELLGKKKTLARTDFFAGACVSPFKKEESELIGQYLKLRKKIESKAKFLITQVGYDARKFHEVLQWLKINGYNIPVLANIYVLPLGIAKAMNANKVPGCVVTDKLVAKIAEEAKASDKGKSVRLLRAAKMYAITKGMGYAGAHIGGHGISYESIEYIIEKGEELVKNWQELIPEFDYPQPEGFYLFEKDPATGLNLEKYAVKASYPSRIKKLLPSTYSFYKIIHALFFHPNPLFSSLQPIAKAIDSSQGLRKAFGWSERLMKVALFGCMSCGDCAIFDIAYLCPMSQCPKNQRNGPCGGSYEGWCEVYPKERKCIWVRAYERMKAYKDKEEDKLGSYIVPPCNWELWETPSWLNFYMGRDHTGKMLGIKSP